MSKWVWLVLAILAYIGIGVAIADTIINVDFGWRWFMLPVYVIFAAWIAKDVVKNFKNSVT